MLESEITANEERAEEVVEPDPRCRYCGWKARPGNGVVWQPDEAPPICTSCYGATQQARAA